MSNEYDRPFTLEKFTPALSAKEAWVGFDNIGHAVNFTAVVNSDLVQVVLHSLKATPSIFFVIEKAATAIATDKTCTKGFTAVIASSADNSCVRIKCVQGSGGDLMAAGAQLIVFR